MCLLNVELYEVFTGLIRVFWHVDPLLGGDREIGDCTAVVATPRPANKTGELCFLLGPLSEIEQQNNGVFCAVRAEAIHQGSAPLEES
jgi:hypothetical protein